MYRLCLLTQDSSLNRVRRPLKETHELLHPQCEERAGGIDASSITMERSVERATGEHDGQETRIPKKKAKNTEWRVSEASCQRYQALILCNAVEVSLVLCLGIELWPTYVAIEIEELLASGQTVERPKVERCATRNAEQTSKSKD